MSASCSHLRPRSRPPAALERERGTGTGSGNREWEPGTGFGIRLRERAALGMGFGNGLGERAAPGMGSGNVPQEWALGMCPENGPWECPPEPPVPSWGCEIPMLLAGLILLPSSPWSSREGALTAHPWEFWGNPGSFPGLGWVLGSWRTARDPSLCVGVFLPRSRFPADPCGISRGIGGCSPCPGPSSSQPFPPPTALGLPGPGIPEEEADREGGLLHRGVQDPTGPGVRHGVPGER